MKVNRLNDLDPKTYIKFLKSWASEKEITARDFILFFTKEKDEQGNINNVFAWGFPDSELQKLQSTRRNIFTALDKNAHDYSYALINLQNFEFKNAESVTTFFNEKLEPILLFLQNHLCLKAYVTILVRNYSKESLYFPCSWMIGELVRTYFHMKDEKLVCQDLINDEKNFLGLKGKEVVYALNFRKEENSPIKTFEKPDFSISAEYAQNQLPQWFVLKPPPRKEKVKLHPGKYPEILVADLIKSYTQRGDIIFDPMSGTGSTQVAALECGRKAYGFEIARHFFDIATERLANIPTDQTEYQLINNDVRKIEKYKTLPGTFDYIITSPPYWDMLNMKGADTQKRRKQKGLHINYSDLKKDLGNYENYEDFLDQLVEIYERIVLRLKANGYFTIIVKNIKKKGIIYTFAWDLVQRLSKQMELTNVQFWLQDDIKIAPYGWGSAWVSNTFHQYILTFKKTGLS
ncbi:MAG: hypothetical protein KDF60_09445 [Calditrichaeota bacterium]|nr:hypothetical protein [Calditrichota bacterium]